jgi:hypothetical protein
MTHALATDDETYVAAKRDVAVGTELTDAYRRLHAHAEPRGDQRETLQGSGERSLQPLAARSQYWSAW